MEYLSNYLKYIDAYEVKRQYERDCYLESMRNYFGDDLPNYIIESANNEEYKDFILESLTTHDCNLLKNKIVEMFGNKYELLTLNINNKEQSLTIIVDKDITNDEQFNILLQIFGYYITTKSNINDKYFITLCPVYAKDVSQMVYKTNHGKLYHFTANENADEILRTGLRCKSSKYRYFPKRIYLYSSDKPLSKIPNIDKFIKAVTNVFDRKRFGISVYKIDLNKISKNNLLYFYTDDYMNEQEAVYTYNNIPPECITKVDYKL